jgi:plasmid replication initiation protein
MSELVRYNNNMNTVAFGKFDEKELDLFFSICFKLKEQETKELVLNFSELRELSQYENRNSSRFIKILDTTYNKMLGLNIKIYENEFRWTRFNLFSKYTVDTTQKTVTISLNQEFRYILNELTGNYTKFELIDFVSLKSGYSKNVFKLLKQWESVGKFEITMEEFRKILDIPQKYRMSEIDKKVLTPILEELPQHFFNLKLQKIKSGKTVSKLLFTWAKGITVITEKEEAASKIKVEHGEQLNIFQEQKIKNPVIELTSSEVVKKKEEMLNLLKSSKNTNLEEKNIDNSSQINTIKNENPLEQSTQEEYAEFLKWKSEHSKQIMQKLVVNKNASLEQVGKAAYLTNLLYDVPFEELLDKNGVILVGGALKMRLRKIAKEKNISFETLEKFIKKKNDN